MKYLLLIHQGTTPLPKTPEWDALSKDDQRSIYAGYGELNKSEGLTPGEPMGQPAMATTVRVKDGSAMVTDGPYAELKDAVGGYFFLEADDLDAAIAVAAKVPAAAWGGGVEIRPLGEKYW
jgi:hypothetical protein